MGKKSKKFQKAMHNNRTTVMTRIADEAYYDNEEWHSERDVTGAEVMTKLKEEQKKWVHWIEEPLETTRTLSLIGEGQEEERKAMNLEMKLRMRTMRKELGKQDEGGVNSGDKKKQR